MNRYLLAAIGVLLMAVLGLGWAMSNQAEVIGQLRQQSDQLVVDLESSEFELQKQLAFQKQDQQLFTRITEENHKLRRESEAAQRLTRLELQDEACADTPLPESIANRLRDRIHRQARGYTGTPPE